MNVRDPEGAPGAARQPSFGRVLHRVAVGLPEPSPSTRAPEVDAAPVTHRFGEALARSALSCTFIVHGNIQ